MHKTLSRHLAEAVSVHVLCLTFRGTLNARLFRSLPFTRRLPVLLHTMFPLEGSMDGYSGRGADTYRTSAEHVVYMLALTEDRKLKEPDDQMKQLRDAL